MNIRISKGETFVWIPSSGNTTIQYGIEVTKDNGEVVEGTGSLAPVWSLSEAVAGATIDSNGLLTVNSSTDVSMYPDKLKLIFIEAELQNIKASLNLIICYEPVFDPTYKPMTPQELLAAVLEENAQIKKQLAEQNQSMSDFMDYIFQVLPDIS